MNAACFTGHRPHKLPWGSDESSAECRAFKLRLGAAIYSAYESGCTTFISGMAQGVDLIAAEAVIELRKTLPDIRLVCAVPYLGQQNAWSSEWRARYDRVIKHSDEVKILAREYYSGCMRDRNHYMVDNSTLLIAASAGRSGGTAEAMAYARKRGVRIHTIEL